MEKYSLKTYLVIIVFIIYIVSQSTENGGFSVSMAITTANESFLNGKEFVQGSL